MNDLERRARQEVIDGSVFGPASVEAAFTGLTFGEQQDYYRRACRTAGAVYSSHVASDQISMTVSLPTALALDGLTEDEARKHEQFLHDRMEDAITWIIRRHREQWWPR